MGLPYHAISDAEYDELAKDLAQVLDACGVWNKAKDMCVGWCWQGSSGGCRSKISVQ
jgi:hypothetical protein